MMNDTQYLRFGGLTFAFCGKLPDRWDDMRQFAVPPCEADVRVRIDAAQTLLPPVDAELLHETETLRAYRRGQTRILLSRALRAESGRDYARLVCQTPKELQLTVCEDVARFDAAVLLGSIMLETVLLHFGRGILHASCISLDGGAVVFTAPSGTGKSTQAELWRRFRGAEILNGDKTLLAELDGQEFACGLPLCGTSGICRNETVPLRAVVRLHQGTKNEITRLRGARAAKVLVEQLYCQPWDGETAQLALALALRVAERIPIFELRCLPDETAVQCLERALREEG